MSAANAVRNAIHARALLVMITLVSTTAAARQPESRRGRLTVSASPLYAFVKVEGEEPSGAGTTASLAYGLTDAIALQLTGIWTLHQIAPTEERDGGDLHMFTLAVGGAYALDMLSFTPMIELALSLLHRQLGGASATDVGVLVGVSAHYWLLDWLSIGARLHYHAFLTDLANYPIYVDLGPSLAVRW